MNEREFDEHYQDRVIETEIHILTYFVEIQFYHFLPNHQYSSHRKADIKGFISTLRRLTKDYPECITLGDLKQNQPELYNSVRTDFLKCINKYCYSS